MSAQKIQDLLQEEKPLSQILEVTISVEEEIILVEMTILLDLVETLLETMMTDPMEEMTMELMLKEPSLVTNTQEETEE